MKKILNDPFAYATETLRGLVRAYPQYYRLVPGQARVIARAGGAVPGKVGIVTGGGSGHLPVFTAMSGRAYSMPVPLAMFSPRPPPRRWPKPSGRPMAEQGYCGSTAITAGT